MVQTCHRRQACACLLVKPSGRAQRQPSSWIIAMFGRHDAGPIEMNDFRARICHDCGRTHLPWAEFCGSCGAQLGGLLPLLATARLAVTGMVVGHAAPEAQVGGNIALIQEGDSVTIDADERLLQLEIADDELERRRAAWTAPAPRYTRGVLAKYARLVSSASRGAVTD